MLIIQDIESVASWLFYPSGQVDMTECLIMLLRIMHAHDLLIPDTIVFDMGEVSNETSVKNSNVEDFFSRDYLISTISRQETIFDSTIKGLSCIYVDGQPIWLRDAFFLGFSDSDIYLKMFALKFHPYNLDGVTKNSDRAANYDRFRSAMNLFIEKSGLLFEVLSQKYATVEGFEIYNPMFVDGEIIPITEDGRLDM